MSLSSLASGVRSYLRSWFPRLIWRKRRAKLQRGDYRPLLLERLETLEAVNSLYNPVAGSMGLTAAGLLANMQTTVTPQRVVPASQPTSSPQAPSDFASAHSVSIPSTIPQQSPNPAPGAGAASSISTNDVLGSDVLNANALFAAWPASPTHPNGGVPSSASALSGGGSGGGNGLAPQSAATYSPPPAGGGGAASGADNANQSLWQYASTLLPLVAPAQPPSSPGAARAGNPPAPAPVLPQGSFHPLVGPGDPGGPQPVATLTAPAKALIGEQFTFTVSFQNDSTSQEGYAPYLDVILPASGADGATSTPNGITFVSASAFGSTLTYNSATATNQVVTTTFNSAGNAPEPFAHDPNGQPLTVTGTPGDQLVSILLPLDAVSPSEPAVPVTITAAVSNAAEQGYALNLQAKAGFARGADPADDPATDPVIQQPDYQSAAVTPTAILVTTSIVSGAPQGKLPTGPDYPVQIAVVADIATGQSFSTLTLSANLPSNLQFVQVNSASAQGPSATLTGTGLPSTTTPGGMISETFSNVVATSGATTAQFTFTAYAPLLDASGQNVLNPVTGADVATTVTAGASGTWDPIDTRHGTSISVSLAANPAIVTLMPYVLSQGYTVYAARPGSAAGPVPGDVLEYTLTAQVSDYFSLSGLVLSEIIPDGERIDPTFTPTLAVAGQGFTYSAAAVASADYTVTPDYSAGSGDGNPDDGTNGTTRLDVRVGDELVQRGQPTGDLLGGLVKSDGSGYVGTGSPVTVTVRYHTVVQTAYTDAYPAPANDVKEGDALLSAGSAVANILSNTSFHPTGHTSADAAASTATVPQAGLAVSLYAVNGSTSLPAVVTAGDNVTYRLQYTPATDNAVAVNLTDYLPRVFAAGTVTTLNYSAASSSIPAPGTMSTGPADTFHALYPTVTPTLSSNTADGEDSLSVSFGNLDDPLNQQSVIDLLVTVQVGSEPEPDGLPLTNWVHSSENNSEGLTSTLDQVADITLAEPVVRITKGVVGAVNPNATFSGLTGPAGVNWAAPGTPATTAPFTGVLSSDKLATQQVDSNATGVDAGDLVRFAVVLENTGRGPNGAYGVSFNDAIPSGFAVPAGGLDLSVTDGTGAPLAYTDLGGGLFGSGLELTDSTTGALWPGKNPDGSVVTTGLNVAVITYDLVAVDSVNPRQTCTSSATLLGYEAAPGGANFATLSAPATVTTLSPVVTRTLTATSQPFTTGSNLAIGEIATYTTVITVPEGMTPDAVLDEYLPAGMAFVSLDSLTVSSGALTTSVSGGFAQVLANAQAALASPGQSIALDFGTVTNTDRDNSVTDSITLTGEAVVLNVAGNQPGTELASFDVWNWQNPTGAESQVGAAYATVVAPQLSISLTPSPTTGEAGTQITYTLTVSSSGGATSARANDVVLSGLLPSELTDITDLTSSGGVLPDSGSYTVSGDALSATFAAIDPGQTSVLTFTATLATRVAAEQILPASATVTWTSLPGATPSPLSAYNSASYERTGNPSDPGGAVNTFSASTTGTVVADQAAVSVALVSTSQPSTNGSNVVIGEEAQYLVTLTVPEGTTPNFSLTDVFPAGMALVSLDGWTASSYLQTSVSGGFTGIFANPTVGTQGSSIAFNFGTLTDTDLNNADTNTITFEVTAVVLNTTDNLAGYVRTDTATANYTSFDGSGNPVAKSVSGSASVTVVEPKLTVSVATSEALADAGDTVTYTVTVSSPTSSTATIAFDATFADAIPAGLTSLSSLTTSGLAPDTGSVVVTGSSIAASWASFPAGQSTTFTFSGTIAASQLPGATLTDAATTTWTSLSGPTPSPLSSYDTATSFERTGNTSDPGGAANTYTASASGGTTLSSSTLEGYVYQDSQLSGQWAVGDPGVAGVTVTLTGTDHLGNSVSLTTTTNSAGRYSFPGLRPGTYTLTKTPPSGWLEGPAQVGSPALGATVVSNDQLGTFTVPRRANTTSDGNNFAEYLDTISGTVYDDANWNGVRDSGESPIAGVTVTLQSAAGYSLTAVSAANGTFSFPVDPGTYSLTETVPSGYSVTSATSRTVIVSTASVGGQDFGLDQTQWVVGQTGGSPSGKGTGTQSGGNLTLHQGDSFQVYAYKDFVVPANPGQLSLSYGSLYFDPTPAGKIKDAFEVGVIDPTTGQPLLVPYAQGHDAEFNLTEGATALTSPGTTVNGDVITLDLSGLVPGTTARLYVKLLNDHGSTASTVTILNANLALGATPKFFVSDGSSGTYRYTQTGGFLGKTTQPAVEQTGVAASADRTRVWTIDANGDVTVYDSRGTVLGTWVAGGVTSAGDIAVLNNDIWVVDAGTETLRQYANAFSVLGTGQTLSPTATYPLSANNPDPTGLAADGTTLWVTDGLKDQVFVYTTGGALQGAWNLDPSDTAPTGITTTPGAANDLWVVDHTRDVVYRYAGAAGWLNNGGQAYRAAADSFPLAADNTDPQGIADPPTVQTNAGTDFWLTFPEISYSYANNPNLNVLYVTGAPGTTVTVTVAGTPYNSTYTIPASGALTVSNIPSQARWNIVPYFAPGGPGGGTPYVVVQSPGNLQASPADDSGDDSELPGAPTDAPPDDPDSFIPFAGSGGPPPAQYVTQDHEVLGSFGVHVTASANVSVTVLDYQAQDTDSYLGLPTPALGTDYLVSSYVDSAVAISSQSLFEIVGTQNNTQVTITPTATTTPVDGLQPGVTRTAGVPYTITLNQGQVYGLISTRTSTASAVDFTGTVIHSTLPVAVIGGNGFTYVKNAQYTNGLSEELWPITDWDTNYLTVPLATRKGGDVFRVLAGTNNTQVTFTSGQQTQVVSLNRGQFYETVLSAPTQVTATNPVALVQYGASNTYPSGTNQPFTGDLPDPTMTQVVPTDRYLSSYTLAAPNSASDPSGYQTDFVVDYANLVVRTADVPNLRLDGNPISPSYFLPVAGTAYSVASILLTPQSSTNNAHTITSLTNTPFGLISYEDGNYDSSSNPGGLVLAALPSIVINYPANPSSYPAGQSLVISGTATAAYAGVPISYVTVNGVPVDGLDSAGHFFQKVTLAQGDNTYHIVAYDVSGASASVDLTITGTEVHTGVSTSSMVAASSVVPVYQRISLNNATHTLYVDYDLQNNGSYPVGGTVLVEIARISDPTVSVLNPDGISADGYPYYNLSRLITGGSLDAAGGAHSSSGTGTLEFSVPNGGQFTYSLIVVATAAQPPRFTSEPNLQVSTGGTYRYTPTTFDPQNEAVTLALAGGPAGMTLTNGQIVWPVTAPAGAYTVELVATDTQGGTATQTFTVTVHAPLGLGPIFDSPPNTNAVVGQAYSYEPVVSDPDGLPVTFTLTNQPAGSQFDPSTGTLTWTPTASQAGPTTVTITATDSNASIPQTFTITVSAPPGDHAPYIVSNYAPTAAPNSTYLYQVRATDADNDTLSYSLTNVVGSLSIDPASGLLSWPTGANGSASATIVVSDGRGLTGTQSFSASVIPVVPAVITGSVTDDVINQPEAGWVVFLDASSTAARSTNDPFTLTDANGNYSLSTTLTGTRYVRVEPQSGWQVDPATPGYYSASLSAGASFTGINFAVKPLTTVPSTPVLATPPNTSLTAGQTYSYTASATDPDGVPLYYSLPGNTTGLSIDPVTGAMQWATADADVGTHTITLQADDHRGGVAQTSFTVTVLASVKPPVFTSGAPPAATAGDPYRFTATAVDPQGYALTYSIVPVSGVTLTGSTLSFTPTTGQVGQTITITLTATDAPPSPLAPSSATVTYHIPVQAAQVLDHPPVFGAQPRTLITVGQGYEFDYDGSDPDSDPLTYTLTGTLPPGLTFNATAGTLSGVPTTTGSYELVAGISDGRGGSASMGFTIVVTAAAPVDPITSPTPPNPVAGGPPVTPTPPPPTPVDVAPRITSVAPAGGRVNVTYSYYATASDPQNNVLHWQLVAAPPGAVIDPVSGHLVYTPPAAALDQTLTITIRVYDDYGGSDTQTITLPITGNHPPVIVSQPTGAMLGQGYTYPVHAVDPDGDPLTYSLAAPTLTGGQLDPRSEGASINALTGVLTWTPQTAGTYVFNIQVSDGQGGVTPQAFAITPGTPGSPGTPIAITHHAPQIHSTPGQVAVAGSPYAYQVVALDPDGNALTYAVSDTSGHATISLTGLLTWTPTSANVGQTENVTVTVSDAYLSATQSYGVAVKAADVPPVLTASTFTATEGQTFDADLAATDVNPGDALTYSFASTPPSGLTLNNTTGHLHWVVPFGLVTTNTNYTVQVKATDKAGNSDTETETITVQVDSTPPTVVLTPASETVVVNQPVVFQVLATDAAPVTSLTLATSTGTPIALRADGTGKYTPTATGTYTFTATATDANGNAATTTTTLTVVNPPPPASSLPVVTLASVSGTVTQPTALSGTVATTATSGNIASWLLEYSSDGVTWITEASASGLSWTGSHTITPTFDPTTLADGVYTLRLSATSVNGYMSPYAYTRVTVGGMLKVGNLTLSVTDLSIPVAGIPITVTRVYDSSYAGQSEDFGYGWRLELGTYTLTADTATLDPFGGFQAGSRLYLKDSSGNTQGYTFEPIVDGTFGTDYLPYFAPDSDDTNTIVVDQTNLLLSPDGGQTFLTAEGDSYNLAQIGTFDVHTPGGSGLVYQVNAVTGQTVDEYDRLGNQLVFDADDIRVQREDANGNYDDAYRADGTQEIIPIVRDGRGRITAITDLRGNSVQYTYDASGNLLTVSDRTGRLTARYGYNGPVPHFLTSVSDTTGTQQLQAQYDSTTHRVSDLTASSGSSANFSYLVAAPGASISSNPNERAIQTSTDINTDPITGATTTATTTEALDAEGNVIRSVDAEGLTTTTTYNALNLPTSVTQLVGTLNLTTTTTYDPTTLQATAVVTPTTKTNITYDPVTGKATVLTDGDGDNARSSYDPTSGNLLSVVSATGAISSFTYNPEGELTSISTAGAIDMFSYDQSGEKSSATDSLGNATIFAYDDNGNQTGTSRQWVDPNNDSNTLTLTTSTIYDGDDRATQITNEQGLTTSTVYDARGNVVQSIDAHGNVTTSVYDAHNDPIEVDSPDGTVTRTLYDSAGRVVYVSDPFPAGTTDFSQVRGTETVYDAAGRVTDSKRVVGLHVLVSIDPRTGIGAATYDATSTVTILSDTRTYYRASDGQVDHTVDPDGAYTYPQYDSLGRQTGTVVGSAPLTFPLTAAEAPLVLQYASTTHFDAAGRATSVTDASGQTTLTQYDGDGRVIRVTAPDGSYTQTHYNSAGQMDYQIDAVGNRTDYGYDAAGRLTTVTQPAVVDPTTGQSLRPVTTYEYDRYGDQTLITDANGNDTRFTFDAFGQQLTRTLPPVTGVIATETNTYNSFGDLETSTDFDGNVTKYIYDYEQPGGTTLGRLMEVDYYPAGSSTIQTKVTYHYDALGRQDKVLETTAGVTCETDTTYDAEGRVTQVTSPEGTIYYAYSDLTGLETKVWTSQSETDFGYDALGRLQTVTESKRAVAALTDPMVATYSYDPDTGNTLALTIISGATTLETSLYGYDPTRHWLQSVTNEDGSGNILSAFTYTRRADGQITQETESVVEPDGTTATGTTNYQYDGLDRLTQEAYTGSVAGTSYIADYTLDLVGNRTSETVAGAGAKSATNTYNARDELLTEVDTTNGTTSTTAFGYDNNGSQTTITTGGSLQQVLLYDARGRLVQVDDGSGAVLETILYTASGARAAVTQNGVETSYIVDEQSVTGYSEVLDEYKGGVLLNSYVYGNSLTPISQNTNAGGPGLSSILLLSDGHSGVRQAYQPGFGMLLTQRFDAFGNTVAKLTAAGNPFATIIGYRGERFDPVLGQYYLRSRLYDPATGRFTAIDPYAGTYSDPLQLMRYGYAGMNPIANCDPSGMMDGTTLAVTIAVSAIAVGVVVTLGAHLVLGFSWQRSITNGVVAALSTAAWIAFFTTSIPFMGVAGAILLVGVGFDLASNYNMVYYNPAKAETQIQDFLTHFDQVDPASLDHCIARNALYEMLRTAANTEPPNNGIWIILAQRLDLMNNCPCGSWVDEVMNQERIYLNNHPDAKEAFQHLHISFRNSNWYASGGPNSYWGSYAPGHVTVEISLNGDKWEIDDGWEGHTVGAPFTRATLDPSGNRLMNQGPPSP